MTDISPKLKEFLTAFGKSSALIQQLQQILDSPIYSGCNITISKSSLPKVKEFKRVIEDYIDELFEMKTKFYSIVKQIDDSNQQGVMIFRYYMGDQLTPWADVAEKMGYSMQRVYEFHSKGLKAFEKIFEGSEPA